MHLQKVQQLDRMSAIEYYKKMQDRALEKANKRVKEKGITKNNLVLHYNSKLDNTFQKNFRLNGKALSW